MDKEYDKLDLHLSYSTVKFSCPNCDAPVEFTPDKDKARCIDFHNTRRGCGEEYYIGRATIGISKVEE